MTLFKRKRLTPTKGLLLMLINAAVLIALELLLKNWMGANDVVSVLFAAGSHAPFWKVSLAICFVLLRLFVWLILPGLVVRELFLWLTRPRDAAS